MDENVSYLTSFRRNGETKRGQTIFSNSPWDIFAPASRPRFPVWIWIFFPESAAGKSLLSTLLGLNRADFPSRFPHRDSNSAAEISPSPSTSWHLKHSAGASKNGLKCNNAKERERKVRILEINCTIQNLYKTQYSSRGWLRLTFRRATNWGLKLIIQ